MGTEAGFDCDSYRHSLLQQWTQRAVDETQLVCNPSGTVLPSSDAASEPPSRLEQLPRLVGKASDHPAQIRMADRIIGRGNMGIVRAARQLHLRREVAVKGLREQIESDEAYLQLLREARVTGVLEHPNVVPVYMLGEDEVEAPLIVMKHITGTPWSRLLRDEERLRELANVGDPLEWHLEVLIQVCNAVHYAHTKRVLHRDLKPDNVMAGEFGEVYVLDWGLAVSLDPDNDLGLPYVADSEAIAGTPGYMAPEMAASPRAVDERSDVYLLGAVLHEILTGMPRNLGKNLIQTLEAAVDPKPYPYDASVPTELCDICRKATALDPDDRYATVLALRRAIENHLHHRHSLQLSSEAIQRLEVLQEHLAQCDPSDERETVETYRLFGECRFALQQAMREWPANEEAAATQQQLLEMMVRFELDQEDEKSARLLIAELPQPNELLSAQLLDLKRQREQEVAQIESLRELGRTTDKLVGRRERARVLTAMGIIWAGLYFVLGALTRSEVLRDPLLTFMVVNGCYGAFLVLAMRVWKERLFETAVNRRFLWALWAAFFVGAVFAPLARYLGMPFGWAVLVILLLFSTVVWMAAAAVDRSLAWAAVPYMVAAVVAPFLPGWEWEAMGVATALAMGTAASTWRGEPTGERP